MKVLTGFRLSSSLIPASASVFVSISRCVCPEGFEGDRCEINIDDCEDNDCENNSTCVDGINNYTCMCSPEYTGAPFVADAEQWRGVECPA